MTSSSAVAGLRAAVPALLAALFGCVASHAQDVTGDVTGGGATGGGGLRLTGTFGAEQTFTDMRARPSGDNGLESATRISPGLRLASNNGRLRGALSYRADFIHRTGLPSSQGSELLNALDAAFQAEAVPNWAYVDARASVSQQSISAFGRPAGDGSVSNTNRTEVATASLSPYVKGPIGRFAEYELRLTGAVTRTRASATPDSNTESALIKLASPRSAALFGWGAMATRQRTDFGGASRASITDRAIVTLFINPDPELQLSVNGGRESNDVGGTQRQSYDNYGASLRWTPSQRTSLLLAGDKRYFGHSHRLQFEHRMARSAIAYADTRDVTSSADANGVGQPTTLYDLFNQLLTAQFPDPTIRDLRVREMIAALGARPEDVVAGGLLAPGIMLQRRQDLSLALQGVRTTLALQAFRSDSHRIDEAAAQQPLAAEPVRQSGYALTLSHQLTPNAAVALLGARTLTQSTATRSGVDQKSASLSLTSRLGPRTSAMLRAGYTVFNSPTQPSRETSLAGSVSLRF